MVRTWWTGFLESWVIGSGTKTEKPSVASYSLVEAAVVIDLNSIVDAPSEDDSELITAKD